MNRLEFEDDFNPPNFMDRPGKKKYILKFSHSVGVARIEALVAFADERDAIPTATTLVCFPSSEHGKYLACSSDP